MPHDKEGRLIEVGDIIKVKPLNIKKLLIVGPVVSIHSTGQYCTGQVMVPVLGGSLSDYFNAADAELILKKDGSEPIAPELKKALEKMEEDADRAPVCGGLRP